MKSISKALQLFSAFGATLALAQGILPGTFKHIIIVVQENRRPDNDERGIDTKEPSATDDYRVSPARRRAKA
jgi:hypothetical protein